MRSAKRLAVLIALIAALILPAMHVAAQPEPIALAGVINHSGVVKFGSQDFPKAAADAVTGEFEKQAKGSLVSLKETEKRLKVAGLKDFPLITDLCTPADIAAVGNRIGSTRIGFLELNGYQEILRANEKPLYHLWISLRVTNCQDGSVTKYQSEGWAVNRKQAMSNAARNLLSVYTGQPAEANFGVRRAEDEPVTVNTKSGYYHLVDCRHLPDSSIARDFETRMKAQAEGFIPCPICFPDFQSGKGSDPALEDALGSLGCRDIEDFYRLDYSPEMIYRIEQVAGSLVTDSSRYHVTFRFRYLDDNEINAFSAANGFIYITRGLMEVIESDDELAFVLAHEIAHVERQHQLNMYKKASRWAFLFGSTNLVLMSYSREQEAEADAVAIGHLKRVGRDWQIYRTFFGRLIDLRTYAVDGTSMFSTHPLPEDRMKALNKLTAQYGVLTGKLQEQQ